MPRKNLAPLAMWLTAREEGATTTDAASVLHAIHTEARRRRAVDSDATAQLAAWLNGPAVPRADGRE